MASYTFTQGQMYDATGAQVGTTTPGGTLDDGVAASPIFTTAGPGSSFTLPGGVTGNYVGTTGAGGFTYPVVQLTAPAAVAGNFLFAADSTLPAFPATMPPAAINPGANFVTCFAAGTEISTAEGFTLVEDLKIGDTVRTLDGRDVAVKWIGRQTVATRFMPAERVRPVTFAAGSLGGGLPTSDLTVTSDHAMLLGDTLCNAGALVNGTTITRVPLEEMAEMVTFYHVETEEHEIILANGAATETFVDNVSRSVFDNFAEFQELYGDVDEMEELGYPRAMSARQVPTAIRALLAAEKAA